MNCRYTKVYTGPEGTSSDVWVKTYTDGLGRTVREEKPACANSSGVTNLVTFNVYNDKGQLERVIRKYDTGTRYMADTIYEYDALGNQTRTGLDIGGNGSLDLNSTDRITHMLAALESQLYCLLDFGESNFESHEYREQIKNLKQAMAAIRKNNTDEGTIPDFLAIDGSRVGYSTNASGYWDDFVDSALSIFAGDLQNRIDDPDNAEEDVTDQMEELARIDALLEQKDTHASSFVSEFFDLANEYEERHC